MNASFAVRYGTINLNQKSKKNIPLMNTKQPPEVAIDPEGCYTLILVDPDAGEGRGEETGLYFLHWLVMNISGGLLERAKTIVSYFPPNPPSGRHTYSFKLYKQDCSLTYSVNRPTELSNWSLPDFIKKYGLVQVGELAMRTGQ
jgi:phosphatidylethanolamine-binding protein (PEBP) family uncharacterized protein